MEHQQSLFPVDVRGRVRKTDPMSSVSSARVQRGGGEVALLRTLTDVYPELLTADALIARTQAREPEMLWERDTLRSALSRLKKPDGREPYIVAVDREGVSRRGRECERYRLIQPRSVAS